MALQWTGYLISLERFYYKVPSCSETGDFLELAPLPSVPTPLRLFLLLIPALPFSFPHMYSVFVIRHADKYCCAQALCYDIFIVCVHVEDVDLNTAFYHALNAALANQSSRFQRFIWQWWFVTVEWSTRWVHFGTKTRTRLPLTCSIFFPSLWSFFISLWSPPSDTPRLLSSVYLSSEKSL